MEAGKMKYDKPINLAWWVIGFPVVAAFVLIGAGVWIGYFLFR